MMGPFDPRNLAILWFTLGNLNPYFRAWWDLAEKLTDANTRPQ